ncbi:hypothetical protein MVEN_01215900 [Mycena venus]|uniref:F-box domain-containing protein n=1 Tax=Mycena venus TaxID=2733690 RepID=A0A8H7CW43_9AGAR|nr:hypothetical protein MVEN_01215900 [Mycena venus]
MSLVTELDNSLFTKMNSESDTGRTTGPYDLASIVASTISRVDARLADLDEEIGRLEDRLQQLEAERTSLSHYRAQNLAILSPLRRIPFEVLAEIFLCTLSSAWYWVDFGGARVTESPWLLTHISRRWRAVPCSTPSLWSVVDLCFGADTNPVSLSMVEAQMARSRAQKLKVHFYGCEISDPPPSNRYFPLFSPAFITMEVLDLQMTSHLVPSLERLRIASLHSADCGSNGTFSGFLWSTSPSSTNIVISRFICLCTNLPAMMSTPPEKSIVLEEIVIDKDDLGSHDILPYLELSVARSSCRLRKVLFNGCPTATAKILEKFPSIVELAIVSDSPADNRRLESLMQTLTISEVPGSRAVAPHLRCLAFASTDDGQIVPRHLSGNGKIALESRMLCA